MSASVRYRIVAEYCRRIEALPIVGMVVRPGMDGEEDKLANQAPAVVAGGQCVVVVSTGHDVPQEAEPGRRSIGNEALEFDVVLSVMLPSPKSVDAGVYTPADYCDLAGWVNGQLYLLTAGDKGLFYEETLPTTVEDPTPGTTQLAEETVYMGGGAEVFDDAGQAATEHVVTVRYRVLRSDYGSPVG